MSKNLKLRKQKGGFLDILKKIGHSKCMMDINIEWQRGEEIGL